MTRISGIYAQGYRVRDAEQKQADTFKARTAMWHELGLAVIDPAAIDDDWTAQAVINEAVRLYGKRVEYD